MPDSKGVVYLIHFDERIGKDGRNGALHYVGWAVDVNDRLAHHRTGRGAKILAYLVSKGIGFKVVRTWDDSDRNFERRIKNGGHFDRHCPQCQKESQAA